VRRKRKSKIKKKDAFVQASKPDSSVKSVSLLFEILLQIQENCKKLKKMILELSIRIDQFLQRSYNNDYTFIFENETEESRKHFFKFHNFFPTNIFLF
jgi:hypothetical protein